MKRMCGIYLLALQRQHHCTGYTSIYILFLFLFLYLCSQISNNKKIYIYFEMFTILFLNIVII